MTRTKVVVKNRTECLNSANPRLLIIAMHYPPFATGSGYLRTLKFCEYLPQFGWDPVVITASRNAFPEGNASISDAKLPPAPVYRAFALDTRHHLSIGKRYPSLLALPDRWVSWWPHGIWTALRAIHRHRPSAVLSTYPIATAHMIGLTVQRLTGLPWIADFRDPMIDDHYPPSRLQRRVWHRLEAWTMSRCAAALFTTPGARDLYATRYGGPNSPRLEVVPNGFDEEDFATVGPKDTLAEPGPMTLIHSGVLYPDIRDPRPMFDAIAALKRSGVASSNRLQVVLRASGSDDYYRSLVDRVDIGDIVRLEPPIPYSDAIAEMKQADGLLLFQGKQANRQVPAKLYEYLRVGRPIIALVDPTGDSARILRNTGGGEIVPIDDTRSITDLFERFLTNPASISAGTPLAIAQKYSRKASTRALSEILSSVALHR